MNLSGPAEQPRRTPSKSPNFKNLFESAPGLYLVLDPKFRIVGVSDAYASATMTRREHILGKGLFEVFPDNPDDPAASGVRNLSDSLQRVLRDRIPDAMPVQKYDIRKPEAEGGGFEQRYWSPLNTPILNANGAVIWIIHCVEDVTEMVRLQTEGRVKSNLAEALRESERTARAVVDGLTSNIAIVDEHGFILSTNQRWRKFAEQNDATLASCCEGANYLAVCDAAAGSRNPEASAVAAGIRDVLEKRSQEFALEYPCHSATAKRWFTIRVSPFPGDGPRRAVISHENITGRKRAEERISQLNRVLAILAGIDHAIIHIPERDKLLDEVCRVVVGTGGFRLAWIGMVLPDGVVEVVAKAGETRYLDGIHIVTLDVPEGRGAVGTAIRENRPVVVADIESDPSMIPWRTKAGQFGLHYMATFPIRRAGRAIGAFQFYAPQADSFDQIELDLLAQVTDDISFALKASDDLAARNDAEAALRESEQNYRTLFTNMIEEVHVWRLVRDERGRIKTWRLVDANPATLKTWGKSLDQIRGLTTDEIFGPGSTEHYHVVVEKIMTEGVPHTFEDYFPNLDKHFQFTSVPLGECFITTGFDITSIRKAEEALRTSEERYRQLIHALPAAVYTCDIEGRITLYNAAATTLWGREPMPADRWCGSYRMFTLDGKRLMHSRGPMALAVSQDEPIRGAEIIIERPDGSRSHVQAFPNPSYDSAGRITGAVNMLFDITGLKLAEQALTESRQRIEGIVGSAMDAIVSVSADQRIVLFNNAAEKMFRCPASEAMDTPLERFIPSRFRAGHPGHIGRFGETGVTSRAMAHLGAISGLRTDGEEFPIEASISQTEVAEQKLFTVILRDITERKRLEREVLEISAHEQTRIGQELHDDICQWLSGVALLAGVLAQGLAQEDPKHSHAAREIADYTKHTLNALRMLARGLTPAVIQSEGLPGALHQLAANTEDLFRIHCAFECATGVSVKNELASLHLYRIAQEAVTNAVRHGGAGEVGIFLRTDQGRISMLIRDDGCGMPETPPKTTGMGLRTMQYRAGIIGAAIEVRPAPGGGTEVVCTFPSDL